MPSGGNKLLEEARELLNKAIGYMINAGDLSRFSVANATASSGASEEKKGKGMEQEQQKKQKDEVVNSLGFTKGPLVAVANPLAFVSNSLLHDPSDWFDSEPSAELVSLYVALGEVLAQVGQLDKCKKALQLAWGVVNRYNLHDLRPGQLLAELYMATGDIDKALKELKKNKKRTVALQKEGIVSQAEYSTIISSTNALIAKYNVTTAAPLEAAVTAVASGEAQESNKDAGKSSPPAATTLLVPVAEGEAKQQKTKGRGKNGCKCKPKKAVVEAGHAAKGVGDLTENQSGGVAVEKKKKKKKGGKKKGSKKKKAMQAKEEAPIASA